MSACKVMVVVVAGGAVLSGCATWNKGLDVAQGALGAASATVEIFRAAGRDTEALWGNVWTPFGLGDTPLTQPFDAPKVE